VFQRCSNRGGSSAPEDRSGRNAAVSKAVIRLRRIEGSNPSPSAQPSGSRFETRSGRALGGLEDFSSQSMGVHGRLCKATDFGGHWRTTGARIDDDFVSGEATTRLPARGSDLASSPGRPGPAVTSRKRKSPTRVLSWRDSRPPPSRGNADEGTHVPRDRSCSPSGTIRDAQPTNVDVAFYPPGAGKRTCIWLSWPGHGMTTSAGP
jgi:hypothetical protein